MYYQNLVGVIVAAFWSAISPTISPKKNTSTQQKQSHPYSILQASLTADYLILLSLDNQGHFLTLERTFSSLGFAVSLFQVSLENADEIHNIYSLSTVNITKIKPVQRKLLLDLQNLD